MKKEKMRFLLSLLSVFLMTNCAHSGIEGRWLTENGQYIYLHKDGKFDASLTSQEYMYGDWKIIGDTILTLEADVYTMNWQKSFKHSIITACKFKRDGDNLFLKNYTDVRHFEDVVADMFTVAVFNDRSTNHYPTKFTLQKTPSAKEAITGRWGTENDQYLFLHEDGRFDASLGYERYLYGDWEIIADTILVLEGDRHKRDQVSRQELFKSVSFAMYKLKKYTDDKLFLEKHEEFDETGKLTEFTRQKIRPVSKDLQYWQETKNEWRHENAGLQFKPMYEMNANQPDWDISAIQKNKEALRFAIAHLKYHIENPSIPYNYYASSIPLLPSVDIGYSYDIEQSKYPETENKLNIKLEDIMRHQETYPVSGAWYFRWITTQTNIHEKAKNIDEEHARNLFTLEQYLAKMDDAEAERIELKAEYDKDTTPEISSGDLFSFSTDEPKPKLTPEEVITEIKQFIASDIKKLKGNRLRPPNVYFFYVPLFITHNSIIYQESVEWKKTFNYTSYGATSIFQKAFEQAKLDLKSQPPKKYKYVEDKYIDALEKTSNNLPLK